MDYTEKLTEINKCELISNDKWKYVITAYEDVIEVEYFEEDFNTKEIVKKPNHSFNLSNCCAIQICEKIIEMRKAYKD